MEVEARFLCLLLHPIAAAVSIAKRVFGEAVLDNMQAVVVNMTRLFARSTDVGQDSRGTDHSTRVILTRDAQTSATGH